MIQGSTGNAERDPATVVRERVADATLRCIARYGLSKTTVDDVAREAALGRATIYRYVGGKRQIVSTTVAVELERLGAELTRVTAGLDELEAVVVAIITSISRTIEAHDALQFVLEFEPEVLLPHITFDHAPAFFAIAGALIEPFLAPHLAPGRASRAAEWVVRVALSFVCSPDPECSLAHEDDTRAFVRAFVLPGLTSTAGTATSPRGNRS